MTVFERLVELLNTKGARFEESRHAPVFTSEEAAKVRGTSLSSGAKALICKADGTFALFVLPGDRRLDSRAVRKAFGFRSMRFATRDEVAQLTTLLPGSIPPFGSLFGFVTYCDEHLAREPRINFNAADHSISISMTFGDYESAEQPHLGPISAPA